jgi:hypothetical protein
MVPSGLNDGLIASGPGRIAEANPAVSDAAQTTQPQKRESPGSSPAKPQNTDTPAAASAAARHPLGAKAMSTAAMPAILRLPAVRAALGCVSNRPIIRACAKYGIPIVSISSKMRGIRATDLEVLISRASEEA